MPSHYQAVKLPFSTVMVWFSEIVFPNSFFLKHISPVESTEGEVSEQLLLNVGYFLNVSLTAQVIGLCPFMHKWYMKRGLSTEDCAV